MSGGREKEKRVKVKTGFRLAPRTTNITGQLATLTTNITGMLIVTAAMLVVPPDSNTAVTKFPYFYLFTKGRITDEARIPVFALSRASHSFLCGWLVYFLVWIIKRPKIASFAIFRSAWLFVREIIFSTIEATKDHPSPL